MALKKAQKKVVLDKVTDITKKLKSAVFVNFHGLTVNDTVEMRSALRKAGVTYTVAKKTLASKAFEAKGFKGDMPSFDGELAIAYSTDLIAPAREVRVFEKKFEGKVTILGGVFEDKYMTKAEMTEIASIPGQQQLYGMFVNLINSPIQRFVIALSEIAKSKTA